MEGQSMLYSFWQEALCFLRCLNPFSWPTRTVKITTTIFFMIALPLYIFIGLQPAPVDAANLPTLSIPAISLDTPVQTVELQNNELIPPATIAGIYQPSDNKLFIFGHSSTVFKNLSRLAVNETFTYENTIYLVEKLETLPKSEISMNALLSDSDTKTIILMTCAGEPLPDQDATHRLIITARAL